MRKKIYLILAVLLQCAFIAAVPLPKLFARLTGQEITIKTAPVDPYDFLSGYHVILSFDISQVPSEPSTHQLMFRYAENQVLYNVLIKGEDGVWQSQSIHTQYPKGIPDGAAVIKGKMNGWRIEYGIEKFFIPEEYRQDIERDLRQNQRQALVDIKVDRFGNAALLRLRIEDRVYEF